MYKLVILAITDIYSANEDINKNLVTFIFLHN